MLVTLTKPEIQFCEEQAELRMQKQHYQTERGVLSNRWSARALVVEGIASEFAAAKGFGCLCNPFVVVGGDDFQRDLWRGNVTISLKIRHQRHQEWYIQPKNDPHVSFPDDFGVLGYLVGDFSFDFPYYFTKADWNQHWHWKQLPSGLKNSTDRGLRRVLTEAYFSPAYELEMMLDQIPDEEISTAQSTGYLEYFRNRIGCGGHSVVERHVLPELAHHTTES
jgi:hypothetical protein